MKTIDKAFQRGSSVLLRTKIATVTAAVLLAIAYMAACSDSPPANPEVANIPDETTGARPAEVSFEFPEGDYSKFDHSTEQHVRMPCLVCHTREDNSAKMNFPGHIPCASCHKEHFADNNHSICSICHTEGNSGGLKEFPTLASFGSKFDHAKHKFQANCTDCHKPARAGTTFSVPTRANSHSTCFQCHSPNAEFEGRDIASCSTCHEAGEPGRSFGGVRAIAASFSHAEHSTKQDCSSCHTIRAGAIRGQQVSAPTVAMHFAARGQSCATCHNGRRAFGGEDFTSCKRCHQGSSFDF